MIYARDLEAEKRPNLTWDMMLEVIELVRYCTIEKGVYSEVQSLIYAGDVRVGIVDVKLARMPDGAVEDE